MKVKVGWTSERLAFEAPLSYALQPSAVPAASVSHSTNRIVDDPGVTSAGFCIVASFSGLVIPTAAPYAGHRVADTPLSTAFFRRPQLFFGCPLPPVQNFRRGGGSSDYLRVEPAG
jgi:hypothetical protein